MFEHLSQNQIEDYSRQKLSGAELLSVSDHLDSCVACRGRIETVLDGDAAFFALHSEVVDRPAAMESRTHPAVELIARYIDGMPAGEELQKVQDHLTVCETCSVAVGDLRAFKNEIAPGLSREFRPASQRVKAKGWSHRLRELVPPPLMRSPFASSAALAVLLLAVTGWLLWQARAKNETEPELAVAAPPATLSAPVTPPLDATSSPLVPEVVEQPVIAQLIDGRDRVTLAGDGSLSGVDYLPPEYQRLLKKSLTSQRLEKSALLSGLNRPASALMGSEARADEFSVIDPVGKVLLSDRPTLRWSPLKEATAYVVELYDETFNLAAASSRLTDTSWTAPQPLQRGAVYSWQVKAIKDGREFRSPRPPAPQAKFRILGESKSNELAKARQEYGSSHLLLGLLYVDAGLLDEAENEFRSLQKENPDSPIVRMLLREIQRLRE